MSVGPKPYIQHIVFANCLCCATGDGGGTDAMKAESAMVLVVDDDASALVAIRRLLRASGFKVEAFSRLSKLIASKNIPHEDACFILDVTCPRLMACICTGC